jgi:hypothetical protein
MDSTCPCLLQEIHLAPARSGGAHPLPVLPAGHSAISRMRLARSQQEPGQRPADGPAEGFGVSR